MQIKSYKELTVWRKSFNLAELTYEITNLLPNNEKYGLISQLRRCAVSIPSNIAEGHQRHNSKEFRQFIGIAKGSAAELETQLLLIKSVYSIEIEEALNLLIEIQKMLFTLNRKLTPSP